MNLSILARLKRKFNSTWRLLDERKRRLTAADEAISLGWGGVTLVSRASGLSRQAITRGIRDIKEGAAKLPGVVRRPGAGRKSIAESNPEIVEAIEELVEASTRGDPETPLRWTLKSTRAIARELLRRGYQASHVKVAQILHSLKYSLQGNRKTEEGADHPDRDAQFRHISAEVKKFMTQDLPVISCDTKKKELVGNYENKGRQWLKTKTAKKVQGHDFPDPKVPRAYPYGIYDIGRNTGFVNIGTDHDTATFAVASIRGWWRAEGRRIYKKADRLLITVDGGGSNGWRLRLWKFELQKLADETGMDISVCHFPPGTSKWNKVEHRLFSFITSNWRGEPLRDYVTMVNLIARTTTAKGLKVICRLDRRKYKTGRKVSDEEMESINMKKCTFHGEWNYVISSNFK
jgi:transposase